MEKARHRLDDGLRNWILKTARKNFWKVAGFYDLDDLIQDGFMCYAKCNQRYSFDLEQRHFMSLVQTTFLNHIKTVSAARHKKVDWPVDFRHDDRVTDPDARLVALGGSVQEEQTLAALLAGLPSELKELLLVLARDARDAPLLTARDKRTPDGRFRKPERETWNEYFCRLIGADPKTTDIEARFREHLS